MSTSPELSGFSTCTDICIRKLFQDDIHHMRGSTKKQFAVASRQHILHESNTHGNSELRTCSDIKKRLAFLMCPKDSASSSRVLMKTWLLGGRYMSCPAVVVAPFLSLVQATRCLFNHAAPQWLPRKYHMLLKYLGCYSSTVLQIWSLPPSLVIRYINIKYAFQYITIMLCDTARLIWKLVI